MSPNEAEELAKEIAEEAVRLSPEEGDVLIRERTKDFPDGIRSLVTVLSAKLAEQKRLAAATDDSEINWENNKMDNRLKVAGFVVGSLAVSFVLLLVVFIPNPSATQWFMFRLVAALGGSGFASALTGFLRVKSKIGAFGLIAGGGFAIFALTYLVNPPSLTTP